jgi:hypothetical protein
MITETKTTNAVTIAPERSLGFVDAAVQTFEGIEKLAGMMAKMGTMPAHLAGKPADCFRIVVQAAKWRMDPFAVAECTSLVHGKMCYEGKLVAAVLQAMGAIEGRLDYAIEGSGQNASITVTGTPKGGKPKSLKGTVKEWRTTGNGSPWDKQPETQLVYRGTRQWARMYAPEAILGVYTPDEFDGEPIDVTATATVRPATPEPARTAPEATADAQQQAQPTATAQPAAHPSIVAARELFKKLGKSGKPVIDRICALYGAKAPTDLKPDTLEGFGRSVAELMALEGDLAAIDDTMSRWEQDAKDAQA